MKAINLVLAMGLCVLANAPAFAETCVTATTRADGELHFPPIEVDLRGGGTRLDPSLLPERTSAILCLRPSIVPRPDDIRVLIELRITFGILEQGPRALFVSASGGRLQIRVAQGALSAAEQAAVDAWVASAQARVDAALAGP